MIRKMLLTNWHAMRWLRLGLALMIAVQAIEMHSWLAGVLAGLLFYQVVTNTGCCAAGNCTMPLDKNKTGSINDIEYEEIKTK